MKSSRQVCLTCVALLSLASLAVWNRAPAADPAYSDASPVEALRAEIKKLESRVLELETKLARHELMQAQYLVSPNLGAAELNGKTAEAPNVPAPTFDDRIVVPSPQRRFADGKMPRGAVKREFNGIEYYLIPLSDAPSNTVTR